MVAMKDIYQVLRLKEQQIDQLRKEVEALRIVAPMLAEQQPEPSSELKFSDPPTPIRQLP
jgi:hypothetical protein